VMACAWLWVRLLQSRSVIYGLALGAVAYCAVFYEPTPSVMGLLFLFLTAYALWVRDIDLLTVVKLCVIVALGFLGTYGLFLAVFKFDLLGTLRRVAADAVIFNARVRRHYYPWIARNMLDLAFGAGLCQAVLFCAVTVMAISRKTLAARNTDGRMAALCLGTAIALVATDLAGINRGEVVRLWIFLACFLQIPAAYICRRLESRAALILVLGTTILQTALSASMLAFLQP